MVRSDLMSNSTLGQTNNANDLKIVFLLALALLATELIALFHKNHFFVIIGIFLVLSIYLLNYFDHIYMKVVLVWLGLSSTFNLFWLIFQADVQIFLFRNIGFQISTLNTRHYKQDS